MKIVVSIASYEKRLSTLHLCLQNIINQSVKPDIFLLYLNRQYNNLPHSILELQENGLEICFTKIDLKSHNKYFYAMQQYPNDILITLDDDVLYPPNLIEKLLISYGKHPNAVSAGRVHKINFDSNGIIMPYNLWDKEVDLYDVPSMELFATGVGGVLYPPKCMDDTLYSVKKIQQFCLYGDDIWLKAMQILNGTPVVAIQQNRQHPPIITGTQQDGLYVINKLQHRNDLYVQNIFSEFKLTRERIIGNG